MPHAQLPFMIHAFIVHRTLHGPTHEFRRECTTFPSSRFEVHAAAAWEIRRCHRCEPKFSRQPTVGADSVFCSQTSHPYFDSTGVHQNFEVPDRKSGSWPVLRQGASFPGPAARLWLTRKGSRRHIHAAGEVLVLLKHSLPGARHPIRTQ